MFRLFLHALFKVYFKTIDGLGKYDQIRNRHQCYSVIESDKLFVKKS